MSPCERSLRSGAAALVFVALAFAGGAAAGDLELGIELPAEQFIRGCLDPVEGLEVTLTVSNRTITPASLPEPRLGPVGGADFEVHLVGAPYGVPQAEDAPARTPVGRHPRRQPVGDVDEIAAFTLKPGESRQFRLNAGSHYNFRAAGRYEMTCLFAGKRSNTVTFEVLPLKRVDVIPPVLLSRLADYECGEPGFPFMFYIVEGQDRFDEIIFVTRAGKGPYEHFEYRRLAKVAVGVTPDVVVAGSKVGLLVPDKTSKYKTRFFVVDFGAVPLEVKGEEFVHEPGRGPELTVDGSGRISAR